jgi:hypothetical protein
MYANIETLAYIMQLIVIGGQKRYALRATSRQLPCQSVYVYQHTAWGQLPSITPLPKPAAPPKGGFPQPQHRLLIRYWAFIQIKTQGTRLSRSLQKRKDRARRTPVAKVHLVMILAKDSKDHAKILVLDTQFNDCWA